MSVVKKTWSMEHREIQLAASRGQQAEERGQKTEDRRQRAWGIGHSGSVSPENHCAVLNWVIGVGFPEVETFTVKWVVN